MFVYPEKCVGCKSCEIACAVEHSETKNIFYSIFETPPPQKRIEVGLGPNFTTFPVHCRHCDPAPCLDICPTGAISRENGTILIDSYKCIKCWMCLIVCPFSIIQVERQDQKALKCDGCIDRKREDRLPACVEACPTKALQYKEVEEITKLERKKVADLIYTTMKEEPVEKIPVSIKMWRDMGKSLFQIKERREDERYRT